MLNRIVLLVPLIIFSGMAVLFFYGLGRDPTELDSALIGKPMPAFSLPSLENEELIIDEDDLIGTTYLINFWGTYCPPCRYEHPYLLELSKTRDIAIVGVNYNDDSSAAREWLKSSGDPFVMDISDAEGKLGIDMGVIGAPETFLVDENGIIRQKYVGILNDQVWKEEFVPLLN